MKTITKIALVALIGIAPHVAFAASTPLTITGVSPKQINSLCNQTMPKGVQLYGCFMGGTINKIFFDNTLVGTDRTFVIAHEKGHYLMDCADLTRFGNDKEKAANAYALATALPKMAKESDKDFFVRVNAGEFICKDTNH